MCTIESIAIKSVLSHLNLALISMYKKAVAIISN
jgi:hypothetical protein